MLDEKETVTVTKIRSCLSAAYEVSTNTMAIKSINEACALLRELTPSPKMKRGDRVMARIGPEFAYGSGRFVSYTKNTAYPFNVLFDKLDSVVRCEDCIPDTQGAGDDNTDE